jgi:hypothetical protein
MSSSKLVLAELTAARLSLSRRAGDTIAAAAASHHRQRGLEHMDARRPGEPHRSVR